MALSSPYGFASLFFVDYLFVHDLLRIRANYEVVKNVILGIFRSGDIILDILSPLLCGLCVSELFVGTWSQALHLAPAVEMTYYREQRQLYKTEALVTTYNLGVYLIS